ncbi:MAG: peptide chain release factor family protein [Thermodesulfobacteriota bacterium]
MTERSSKKRYATDLKILYGQVRAEYYRSRGPGGQRKDKKETAVRLKHLPSGVTVTATESRYQAVNKRRAFQRLQEKLKQLNKPARMRIPTVVSLGEKEKRREEKRRWSQKKRWRKAIGEEDLA